MIPLPKGFWQPDYVIQEVNMQQDILPIHVHRTGSDSRNSYIDCSTPAGGERRYGLRK